MKLYQGIEIAEYMLFVKFGIFTFLFVIAMVAAVYFLCDLLRDRNGKSKENDRIKNLKERAASDELAKRLLEKAERKNKRKRKRNRGNVFSYIAIWMLLISVLIGTLCYGVIPMWTDYIKKDYVIYTGEITVHIYSGRSYIELDDGTHLYWRADFTEEDTYGTVVYSKRCKVVLGGHR